MKDLFAKVRPQILIFGLLLGGIAVYALRFGAIEVVTGCTALLDLTPELLPDPLDKAFSTDVLPLDMPAHASQCQYLGVPAPTRLPHPHVVYGKHRRGRHCLDPFLCDAGA